MWEFECSEVTGGPRAGIWALWSDPTRWSEFDAGIEWARIDGPFVAGARGKLKPKGGPKSAIEIVAAEPERSFVSTGELPFARARFEHELSDAGDGKTRVTHRIRPLGSLYARLLHLRRNEVEVVSNLARMVTATSAPAAGNADEPG